MLPTDSTTALTIKNERAVWNDVLLLQGILQKVDLQLSEVVQSGQTV